MFITPGFFTALRANERVIASGGMHFSIRFVAGTPENSSVKDLHHEFDLEMGKNRFLEPREICFSNSRRVFKAFLVCSLQFARLPPEI